MPRIRTNISNCVLYHYPSKQAAQAGEMSGGSGFLVCVKSASDANWLFPYVVTNRHVIEGRALVVRLNTKTGGTDIFESKLTDWTFHPNGDDLAVANITPATGFHNYLLIPDNTFATEEMVKKAEIGVGDDVVMVGRLVNHEGKQQNTPVVRFGNVSLMPHEPIPLGPGRLQECFLVDCQSIGGFSGSPVFLASGTLLGINMGFMTTPLGLLDAGTGKPSNERIQSETGKPLIPQTNSGLMIVIPAWRLDALLKIPQLVGMRAMMDQLRNPSS